ncbi:MAG: hypothetical protein IJ222_10975 [Bacteroidales bacterium]|nr:hypothetical protein [Bacteroidales bacterium]
MEDSLKELNNSVDKYIADGTFTEDAFNRYAQSFCWYCGNTYVDGKVYKDVIHFSRYESKRVGAKRVSRTEYKTIEVHQCRNCWHIHEDESSCIERAQSIFKKAYWGLAIAVPIILFLSTEPWDNWNWEILGILAFWAVLLSFAAYFIVRAIVMMIVSEKVHKEVVNKYHLRKREDIPAVKKALKHKWKIDRFL